MSETKKKNFRIDTRLAAMISSEKYNKRILRMYELMKNWGARKGYKISMTFEVVFNEFIKNHKDFPPFKEFLDKVKRDEYDL